MKHSESRPVRLDTDAHEGALKPRAVKVSGETYAQLYRFMGALQMEYGEKVSADDAISKLLGLGQDVVRVVEGKTFEPNMSKKRPEPYVPKESGPYILGVSEPNKKPQRIIKVPKRVKNKLRNDDATKIG